MNMMVQTTSTSLGALGSGPSLLGERKPRLPQDGKIHAGIMVLTKAAANNQRAQSMYQQGVRDGVSFKALNNQIKSALKFDKNPMTPRNVQYFTVRDDDFTNPEHAKKIIELHGDQNDHIYRLPIRLPMDSWLALLPHELAAYYGREKRYWSAYDANGQRVCMMKDRVKVDPKTKRAPRGFGERPALVRGVCDPDNCLEYQALPEECSLKGQLLFQVPGVPMSSLISLSTSSTRGLEQMRTTMALVATTFYRLIGAERLSGLADGQPFFWLTKQQQNVAPTDRRTGKDTKTKQWVPVLEADLDLIERVFAAAPALAIETATASVSALEGPTISLENNAIVSAKDELRAVVKSAGIKMKVFLDYAARQHGDDWASSVDLINSLIDEVKTAAGTDIEDYIRTISIPF